MNELITLRDLFAAIAMHAYVFNGGSNAPEQETFADWAYSMADRMLEQRDVVWESEDPMDNGWIGKDGRP